MVLQLFQSDHAKQDDCIQYVTTVSLAMTPNQGRIYTPDCQISLGLMVGIWASLGIDFGTFQYFASF